MTDTKKIYFLSDEYSYKSAVEDGIDVSVSYDDTFLRINKNQNTIFTTQMALMSYNLFTHGYRIFIVSEDDHYEITMLNFDRMDGRGFTARDNIFDMWKSGMFNNKPK